MPSPLYQQFQPQNNLLTMLTQFKQNPIGMLSSRYNIPQNMTDPNEILQHLLNTNQVSQDQVNRVMQMRNNPQIQQILNSK
jgi:hypothetical protein